MGPQSVFRVEVKCWVHISFQKSSSKRILVPILKSGPESKLVSSLSSSVGVEYRFESWVSFRFMISHRGRESISHLGSSVSV